MSLKIAISLTVMTTLIPASGLERKFEDGVNRERGRDG